MRYLSLLLILALTGCRPPQPRPRPIPLPVPLPHPIIVPEPIIVPLFPDRPPDRRRPDHRRPRTPDRRPPAPRPTPPGRAPGLVQGRVRRRLPVRVRPLADRMTMSEQNECEAIIVSADAPPGPTGPTRPAGNTGAGDGCCNGVHGAQGRTCARLGRGGRRRGSIILPVQPHMDLRRNAPCPCGSGKKAKKCCLRRLAALSGLPPVVRTQALVAGILGHWPTVEPPRPVPAVVQQRFYDLAAQQTAAKCKRRRATRSPLKAA